MDYWSHCEKTDAPIAAATARGTARKEHPMQDKTRQILGDLDRQIERAIVLQNLGEDRADGRSHAELEAELDRVNPSTIGKAIAHLRDEGVIELADELLHATRPTLHLNELELIAV